MERNIKSEKNAQSIEKILINRALQYGSFTRMSLYSQELKNIVRKHPEWNNLRPFEKEAIEMILHKIVRLVNGGGGSKHMDTVQDIQGYAKLIESKYIKEIKDVQNN